MERTLGGRSGIPVRPVPAAGRGVLDRHPAAHRVRVAARRARVLLHAHGHHRPVPADDRQGGLLPARLGRQRAADRAAGAERLRRALRPVGCRTTRSFVAAGEAGQGRAAGLPAQLHRAVRAAHRGRRARLRGDVAARRALRGLVAALHDDQRRLAAGVAAGVPAQPRARRGVPGRGADAVGRHVPDRGRPGGARGPRATPARSTGSPSTRPTGRRCGSRRRGPSCCPPASPWSRTRTTRGTRGCSAAPCATPVFGVEVPVYAHPLAEPDKGSGIAMVCTFGDLTDVTWWRELDLPTAGDHRAERPAARRPAGRGARRAVRGAGGQDRVLGAGADGRAAADERRPGRGAAAGHPAGEVLRAGRQAARDRHLGAVVHTERRARCPHPFGTARPGPGADLAPRAHAGALRELGGRRWRATG